MNAPAQVDPPESRHAIGEPVLVRKTGATGRIVGGFRANHIHSTFYEVETEHGVLWPLTDADLEPLPC